MNLLVTVGGAVLALGLLILVVTVLRRPSKSPGRLTVAALQARLAEEGTSVPDEAEERLADHVSAGSNQPHTS